MPWHYQLHTKHFNYCYKADFAGLFVNKRIESVIWQLSFLCFENTEHLKWIDLRLHCFPNTSASFFDHMLVSSSHMGHNTPLHDQHCWEETTVSKRAVRTTACVLFAVNCCKGCRVWIQLWNTTGVFLIASKNWSKTAFKIFSPSLSMPMEESSGENKSYVDCRNISVMEIKCYFEYFIESEWVWYQPRCDVFSRYIHVQFQ